MCVGLLGAEIGDDLDSRGRKVRDKCQFAEWSFVPLIKTSGLYWLLGLVRVGRVVTSAPWVGWVVPPARFFLKY